MPQHKSAKKRLLTNEKARVQNKTVRSAIRTSLKKIRSSESQEEIQKEIPNLFSMLDKAANKRRANFNANKAGNYKRKVHKHLATVSSAKA